MHNSSIIEIVVEALQPISSLGLQDILPSTDFEIRLVMRCFRQQNLSGAFGVSLPVFVLLFFSKYASVVHTWPANCNLPRFYQFGHFRIVRIFNILFTDECLFYPRRGFQLSQVTGGLNSEVYYHNRRNLIASAGILEANLQGLILLQTDSQVKGINLLSQDVRLDLLKNVPLNRRSRGGFTNMGCFHIISVTLHIFLTKNIVMDGYDDLQDLPI